MIYRGYAAVKTDRCPFSDRFREELIVRPHFLYCKRFLGVTKEGELANESSLVSGADEGMKIFLMLIQ